jgi:ubiquinol-cytochrome c reductase iron-sulfur subunit
MADHAAVGGEAVDLDRRKFLTRATIATGAVGVVCAAIPFVESWSPSERAKALGSPVELDISKLEAGQMAITVWRRQPVYVVHRSPDMIKRVSGHDADLKDPDSEESDQPAYCKNADRARMPEFLVVIGICTHLGCLVKQRFDVGELYPSWPGGFFCPCHGSRYDLSARVFDGSPAPLNLNVPRYYYPKEHLLVVGQDEKGVAS